ncbi:SPW repeat domain-containing protein [Lentzea sp. CA-135723]|uniref:SPW repeat domain-containing protein n=1 Tax=Lentzea sp. CA-135723 TaxID=3239950 RepID=UPI003D8C23BA
MAAFLAGVWLIAAPPVLHFGAATHAFRPYWVSMGLAVVIMLLGMVRAMAPLDVPFIRHLTIALALWLIVVALLRADGGTAIVWLNQLVVGALIALSAGLALLISFRGVRVRR